MLSTCWCEFSPVSSHVPEGGQDRDKLPLGANVYAWCPEMDKMCFRDSTATLTLDKAVTEKEGVSEDPTTIPIETLGITGGKVVEMPGN